MFTQPFHRSASSRSNTFGQNNTTSNTFGSSIPPMQRQVKKTGQPQSNSSESIQTAPAQRRVTPEHSHQSQNSVNHNANQTGLPDDLRVGAEILTSLSMDDVTVQRNSSQPAKYNALAITQGTAIHLASGQEEHLKHELGHVVQQMQGRVTPTMQLGGVAINDDPQLEKEATQIGEKAAAIGAKAVTNANYQPVQMLPQIGSAVQAKSTLVQRAPSPSLQTPVTVPQIENTPPQPDNNSTQKEVLTNQRQAIKLLESKRELLGSAADEIEQSIWKPEKINQGQFNFCGSNAFLMAIALNDPVNYMKYIIDLYTAKATYEAATSGNAVASQTAKLGSMSVDVDQGVATTDASEFAGTDPGKISQTDWMSMGSIRTQEKANAPDYSGETEVLEVVKAFHDGGFAAALRLQPTSDTIQKAIMVFKQWIDQRGQTLQSLAQNLFQRNVKDFRTVLEASMPSEITAWLTNYGASNIVQKAAPFNPSKSQKDIQEANSFLNASQGKMVMLNINLETLTGQHSFITNFDPTQSHWALMKTPMVLDTGVTPNVWKGTVYSWGTIKDLKIDGDKISNSFFGFIAATITPPQSRLE